MFATVRRYEGVDASRTDELTKKVNETLIPRLSKLPGFDGGARREAGERASECAEDHLRRGNREEDERSRPGVTPPA